MYCTCIMIFTRIYFFKYYCRFFIFCNICIYTYIYLELKIQTINMRFMVYLIYSILLKMFFIKWSLHIFVNPNIPFKSIALKLFVQVCIWTKLINVEKSMMFYTTTSKQIRDEMRIHI